MPASLAVAFVASSTVVSAGNAGCDPNTPDPTPDGGRIIESQLDGGTPDAEVNAPVDASVVDAPPGDDDVDEPPRR